MTTIVSSSGRILLPVKIRRQDDVRAGQKFEVERIACGDYRLKRMKGRSNKGLVDRFLACPEKGWFHPLDRIETTTDIEIGFP